MINQNHLQLQNLCLQEEIVPYRGSSTGVVARVVVVPGRDIESLRRWISPFEARRLSLASPRGWHWVELVETWRRLFESLLVEVFEENPARTGKRTYNICKLISFTSVVSIWKEITWLFV
jgi:hypothetical protein